MITNKTNKRVRKNYPLSAVQLQTVENYVTAEFINKMVPGQFYAVRDVFGGPSNHDWVTQHPTLAILYYSRCTTLTQNGQVDKKAFRLAAIDLGYITFNLLDKSSSLFEQRKRRVNEYKLL